MLILLTVVPVIMCILLIRENCKLQKQVKKLELSGDIEDYHRKIETENREIKMLNMELSKENQAYRKVIEKWQMEQDEKNKDYWGR